MFQMNACHRSSKALLVVIVVFGLGLILPVKAVHAATYTVTNTANSGAGSLRQAIIDANNSSDSDTITFNISGAGPHTITLTTELPSITNPVIIDGLTQPGASCANWPPTLKIQLSGVDPQPAQGWPLDYVFYISAGQSTIRGLVMNKSFRGVYLASGDNRAQCNIIGTDITGTVSQGYFGVQVDDAPNNIIGGTSISERNLIATGVDIRESRATGNIVQGNFIGVDLTGTRVFTDTRGGVSIEEAANNIIGGTSAAARNIIGGGVHIGSDFGEVVTANNVVQGNYIGTDPTGTTKLINFTGSGITIERATNNVIGGTAPGAGNLIAGYTEFGVLISGSDTTGTGSNTTGNRVQGNLIGTNVDGTVDLTDGSTGVRIQGAANTLVGGTTAEARNVISGNTNAGVLISGGSNGDATDNLVQGNYIGTNAAGSAPIPNTFAGIYIFNASKNLVGGSATGAGNVISGNGYGVRIAAGGAINNRLEGNLIGTTVTGSNPLANQRSGVSITSANTTVGGTTAGARNVIAANNGNGIELNGSGATGSIVQGNYIGTAINGSEALGNTGHGVVITDVAYKNTIGGTGPGAANIIASNGGSGVFISRGFSNAVQGNRITANGALGIDLGDAGPTPNDVGDADQGANQLMNAPSLLHNRANIPPGLAGMLNSTATTTITVDLYANSACNPSGFGEGEAWLGSKTVATDANGNASFSFTLRDNLKERAITATATDPDGNTSEFSSCLSLLNGVYLPLVTR